MQKIKNLTIGVFLFQLIFTGFVTGQNNDDDEKPVYKVKKSIEAPASVGLFGLNMFGFEYLRNKPRLEEDEIFGLDKSDIWWFDRIAIEQDASFRHKAHDISDFYLNSSVLLPGILALDKNIRRDWLDILVMYTELHAVNTAFYLSVAANVLRTRPFNYNQDVPLEDKLQSETRNSFFSGHVSTAASASFFMAKVYCDYHPELGNKKYWFYAAALIPPSLVGYYRIKALKHFPSDVIIGMGVGIAAGILIPEIHRIKEDDKGISFVPFAGEINGLKLCYTF